MIRISQKPNFLVILTDQQRLDHLSCYNNNMILKTPNIDRIANEGIKFTNFYCNNPICMPNRSTIFTGQYPSVHGVTTNGRNLPQGSKTFVDILLNSGIYHTASFGKIHLNYFGANSGRFQNATKSQEFAHSRQYRDLTNFSPYFGLDEVKLVSGHGPLCGHPDYINWVKRKIERDPSLGKPLRIKLSNPDNMIQTKLNISFNTAESLVKLQVLKHKVPEELYSTTFVKENTIEFLERFSKGTYSKENFFVFCSFPDPHHPFSPPGKYYDMYRPEDVILSKTFNDTHKNSSEFNRNHYNTTISSEGTEKGIFPNPKDLTEGEAKSIIAASYGMEKMIDDAVGEVLDALTKLGLSENTVIIFTTDHGDLGGDHRFFFKGPFLYQGLIKVPFLIKVPNGQTNKDCNTLASSIDIPETILELAGIPIPDFMQGKSLIPVLKNPEEIVENDVLIEMDDDHNNEKTRTLITDEWRITIFSNHGDLYNLKEDPNELNNLWLDNSFSDIKIDLLLKLFNKTSNISKSVIRECGF
ncbi:MAG TPA: sulfatase-like hydrolase/transferase [Candidatus Nanopelagicaceae bacterium]|nr:sulfatase-like hydrolase/transferase [Candidatus Nanopelagicaceae bacterium]